MRRPFPLAFLLFITAASSSPAASAQDDDGGFSQIQNVARAKAEQGLELYGEGKYQEAYEHFRVAEDLFHAPTLVLYMAHCQAHLGNLLEARARYESVANETVPEDAAEAFREAPATARTSLEALAAEIPKLELVVRGVAPDAAYVTLDGKPAAVSPETIEANPGSHRIAASATGARTVVIELELERGADQRVMIELEPIIAKAHAPPPPEPPPPPPRPPQPGSVVPAFIAFGVGAAALTAGAISGAIVVSEVDRIREGCDDDRCPTSLERDRDEVQPIATFSTAAFIVGGGAATTGLVLLLVRPGAQSSVTASAGPSSIVVRGSF